MTTGGWIVLAIAEPLIFLLFVLAVFGSADDYDDYDYPGRND